MTAQVHTYRVKRLYNLTTRQLAPAINFPYKPRFPHACMHPIAHSLKDEIHLGQRQRVGGLGGHQLAIGLDTIALRVDLHLGHAGVELHVPFAYLAAVAHGFDALGQVVRVDGAGVDGRGRDEGDGERRHEGAEHGSHDYRLDGWDGRVGVALQVGQ